MKIKSLFAAALAAIVGLAATSPAYAIGPFDGITVDTAHYMTLAVVVVTALAGIWAVKKVIGLLNR